MVNSAPRHFAQAVDVSCALAVVLRTCCVYRARSLLDNTVAAATRSIYDIKRIPCSDHLTVAHELVSPWQCGLCSSTHLVSEQSDHASSNSRRHVLQRHATARFEHSTSVNVCRNHCSQLHVPWNRWVTCLLRPCDCSGVPTRVKCCRLQMDGR